MPRATIRLTPRCDNACRFCGQHGTTAGEIGGWYAHLVAARDGGDDEVTFTGGEPTLSPALEPAIAAALSLGYVAIGVQSNGRALADRALVDRLCAAGLTDVHLSIHGARAAVHDYHVGVVGAFESIVAALGHLRAASLTIVATTVLTRSSARTLIELPAWLAHHGIAGWSIAIPHAAGRAGLELDRILPRLALALPFALHALDAATKRGIAVAITGAPACLLGPWLAEAISGVPRSFARACEGCAVRPACPGVDAHYLARFGGDELHARTPVDAQPSMPAALQRMFVGPGELVPVDIAAHEPVATARRRLPVLDRPTPGREETRRKPESAAALFPALHDDEE